MRRMNIGFMAAAILLSACGGHSETSSTSVPADDRSDSETSSKPVPADDLGECTISSGVLSTYFQFSVTSSATEVADYEVDLAFWNSNGERMDIDGTEQDVDGKEEGIWPVTVHAISPGAKTLETLEVTDSEDVASCTLEGATQMPTETLPDATATCSVPPDQETVSKYTIEATNNGDDPRRFHAVVAAFDSDGKRIDSRMVGVPTAEPGGSASVEGFPSVPRNTMDSCTVLAMREWEPGN